MHNSHYNNLEEMHSRKRWGVKSSGTGRLIFDVETSDLMHIFENTTSDLMQNLENTTSDLMHGR